MNVGVLTMELALLEAHTLKDKRRVIRSTTQRIRNVFNASVAEVAYRDTPRRCRLAVAMVSSEGRAVQSQLDKVVELVRRVAGLTLVDYTSEMF